MAATWNYGTGMSRCEAKLLPVFNRMMIFGTTDFTNHVHPDPFQGPEGVTRNETTSKSHRRGLSASDPHAPVKSVNWHKSFQDSGRVLALTAIVSSKCNH